MATEKRLIDANAIYDAVEQRYKISSGIEHRCERDLLDLICSAETVDAVEVVHAYWRDNTTCSNCTYFAEDDEGHTLMSSSSYCPNCGAKMDGDGNA